MAYLILLLILLTLAFLIHYKVFENDHHLSYDYVMFIYYRVYSKVFNADISSDQLRLADKKHDFCLTVAIQRMNIQMEIFDKNGSLEVFVYFIYEGDKLLAEVAKVKEGERFTLDGPWRKDLLRALVAIERDFPYHDNFKMFRINQKKDKLETYKKYRDSLKKG